MPNLNVPLTYKNTILNEELFTIEEPLTAEEGWRLIEQLDDVMRPSGGPYNSVEEVSVWQALNNTNDVIWPAPDLPEGWAYGCETYPDGTSTAAHVLKGGYTTDGVDIERVDGYIDADNR
jgi:hypothetical protein